MVDTLAALGTPLDYKRSSWAFEPEDGVLSLCLYGLAKPMQPQDVAGLPTDGGHNHGLKSRENEVSPAPDEESFTAQSMVQVDTFNTIVRNAMAPSR